MRGRTLLTIAAVVLISTLFFAVVVHQVSNVWIDIMLRPEVRDAIRQSMVDQKEFRRLDPVNEQRYRDRFERNRQLLARLDVIGMNREVVLRRLEITLAGAFAVTLFAATLLWTIRQRRAEERRRREYLDRLASWQEASRRHAHEIKTPLTAARLEVDRLVSAAGSSDEVSRAAESVYEELDRITRFTKEFSSFGALAQPLLRPERFDAIVAEYCAMFENAWPNVALRFDAPQLPVLVDADRDLLRQVLVNLCTNGAHAIAGKGTMTFAIARDGDRVHLDVSDDGAGIPESIRSRIFEPYVTTRQIGHGMGLGLAISRKILLDHGGDLTLVSSAANGTTFRLTLRTPVYADSDSAPAKRA